MYNWDEPNSDWYRQDKPIESIESVWGIEPDWSAIDKLNQEIEETIKYAFP